MRDRESIDFLFLSPSDRPSVGSPGAGGGGGGGGGAGGRRCQETLINGEEGRPDEGLAKDTALRIACVYSMSSYIFGKAARAGRLFTFSQAAGFYSRDRNLADSNLNF